jgi:putative flippase GtrA
VEGLEPLRLPPRAVTGSCGMKPIFRETLGYATASGCALVVDMAILWSLVHFLSWNYLAAATTSFLAGAVVAYEVSIRLAFRQHRLKDRRAELVTFVAIGIVGLLVNAAVMFVSVKYFGLHYLIAKCVAAGFTFMCNFIARRQILFVKPSTP